MITNFEKYNEARFSDVSKLSLGNGELYTQLKSEIDREFDIDKKLIKYITLNKRINSQKIRFIVDYYNTAKHDIYLKLKERTSFKSVEEFNDLLKNMLNFLIPDKLDELFRSGKYAVYFVEHNISIIFNFDINDYLKEEPYIKIKTLISQLPDNIQKIFFIE